MNSIKDPALAARLCYAASMQALVYNDETIA
jgi:hypothetical protein